MKEVLPGKGLSSLMGSHVFQGSIDATASLLGQYEFLFLLHQKSFTKQGTDNLVNHSRASSDMFIDS